MNSARPGRSTSPVEVTNVSVHGFWLFVAERELFVPFAQFPWFREAAIGAITNVQLPSPHHLYWPDLDIDQHFVGQVMVWSNPAQFPKIVRVR